VRGRILISAWHFKPCGENTYDITVMAQVDPSVCYHTLSKLLLLSLCEGFESMAFSASVVSWQNKYVQGSIPAFIINIFAANVPKQIPRLISHAKV
jgi:hypothetical protein